MGEQDEKEMSREEMLRILGEEDTGVLCLSKSDEPYGVTVSYALIGGEIVFHCKKTGKKIDFIHANPRACFVVSRHPERTKPHKAEDGCNFKFESVVCTGSARIVEDLFERFQYLQKFKEHFDKRLAAGSEEDEITEATAEKVSIVAVSIDEMTGRRSG